MSIHTPLFESTNIKLTAFDHELDPEIEAQWTNEPSFARMAYFEPMLPRSPYQIKKTYVSIEKAAEEDKDLFYYQARLKDSNHLIGFGSIRDLSWTHRVARVRLGIGLPENHRKGYGTQILELLVNFSFYELNLRRLAAIIPSYNEPAIGLFKHFGFEQEACRREAYQKDGAYWDSLVFGYGKEGK